MSKATQADRVLDYIEEWGSITQLEALRDLGVMRLAARMSEIIRDGVPIEKTMEASQNRYGQVVRYARYRRV